MAHIIGGNHTLAAGRSTRHWYTFGPVGDNAKLGLAMPPSIATISNRVVTVAQGIEHRSGSGLVYTTDVRCDNVTGTGVGGAYRFIVGTIV